MVALDNPSSDLRDDRLNVRVDASDVLTSVDYSWNRAGSSMPHRARHGFASHCLRHAVARRTERSAYRGGRAPSRSMLRSRRRTGPHFMVGADELATANPWFC